MAEYIELNLVIEALAKIAAQTPFGKSKTVAKCIDAVELLPSSPHIPRFQRGRYRRTGRICDGFIEFQCLECDGFIEVQCLECEETHLFDMILLETAVRYCPYCGVKWDGGADNG